MGIITNCPILSAYSDANQFPKVGDEGGMISVIEFTLFFSKEYYK